jgi:hypothetical protein
LIFANAGKALTDELRNRLAGSTALQLATIRPY